MSSVSKYQCAKKTVWKPSVRGPVDPFLRSGGGEYGVEVGFGDLLTHVFLEVQNKDIVKFCI